MSSGRPVRRQFVLEVVAKEALSPSLVRIHAGGPQFDDFIDGADEPRLAATDKYVKLLFADPNLGLEPPYDFDALREVLAPEQLPVRRTYTVRSIDYERKSLAIDFVVHGDEGVAGPWAARAAVGDRIVFSGPGGQYRPAGGGHWHLFAGDDSAIPAIVAAVEALDDAARGLVIIEVDSVEHQVAITPPVGVDVRWLHRRTTGGALRFYGEPLVEAIQALKRPDGEIDVFLHGEREAMKRLRPMFSSEWGLDRRAVSLSAYWAQGRAEDAFQAEKREPIGKIFDDD